MKFDFLINIIFSHEYYNECIPSEIFEIENPGERIESY